MWFCFRLVVFTVGENEYKEIGIKKIKTDKMHDNSWTQLALSCIRTSAKTNHNF